MLKILNRSEECLELMVAQLDIKRNYSLEIPHRYPMLIGGIVVLDMEPAKNVA